jgi:hypothetical protein
VDYLNVMFLTVKKINCFVANLLNKNTYISHIIITLFINNRINVQ